MSTAALAGRRDVRVMGLVGTAHLFSHFYQLALAPLFPLIHDQTGYSYTELGVLVGVLYAASGLAQTPAGFLVDRFGARKLLLAGLAVVSIATMLIGMLPYYPVMVALAVVVGIGNSVFHPSDYSILSASIGEHRMGRAYAVHMFGGYIGYAAAPLLMIGLGAMWGWQTAVIAVGLGGVVAFAIIFAGSADFHDSTHERGKDTDRPSLGDSIRLIVQAPIVLCFLFFALVAMGSVGLQNFSPTVLSGSFGVSLVFANGIVTAMLASVPVGIVVGGVMADRTAQHGAVIAAGFSLAAVALLAVGFADLPTTAVIGCYLFSGFMYGVVFPSRDMLVRRATPKGSSGKVFGFAYSGLDLGAAVTPVVFGWLVDTGWPRGMFLFIALLWLISIFTIRASSRAAERRWAGAE